MTIKTIHRFALGAATGAALALSAALPAVAQEGWQPDGPVTFALHTRPGGGVDVFVRTLAQSLEPLIGQPVVIDNLPGGGGATQMSHVRAAEPDGLTLGVNTVTHFTSMLTNLQGVFTPDDFSWIALSQIDPILFFVDINSDLNSMSDLVERARDNDGEVNIGGFGPVGSMQNIAMEMLEENTGVTFNWVAFESTPDIIAAVLGGHIDVGVANLGPALSFFEAGRLKGLGVLGDTRLETLPDMQTWAEEGFDVDTSWLQVRGVFGPAGMDPMLQQQIADAIHIAMQSDTYQEYARASGVIDSDFGPQEYTSFVQGLMQLAEVQLRAAGMMAN